MAPLPSRKSLEAMKRVDLQKICKDYGVRANLKSEALIDLLLDTQTTPAPRPHMTRRSVSTRIPSKAGPSRVSSMIVHDIDEEDNEENNNAEVEASAPPTPQPSLIPPPRTRKAKEMQVRLGVGKPIAAGGTGPRAITRSSESSRNRRLKSSRSIIKPMEATIEEEPEVPSVSSQVTEPVPQMAIPSPPHLPHDASISDIHDKGPLSLKKIIEDATRPLQEQIHTLKSKLDEVDLLKADLANLRIQVTEISKAQNNVSVEVQSLRGLSAVVTAMKEEMQQLREALLATSTPPQPSTPKSRTTQLHEAPAGFGMPSTFQDLAGSPSASRTVSSKPKSKSKMQTPPQHPGITESTLGKRHRDSVASDITGILEEGQEEGCSDGELAKRVMRPTKKKPRIEKDDAAAVDDNSGGNSRQGSSTSVSDEQREASSSNEDVPNFTVFQGSEEALDYLDPPPPTNRLPEYFEPDSPTGSHTNLPRPRSTVPTSSAHASENQPHGFGFGFLPVSSTPQNPFMASFPYPDAPQSPSPAGPSSAAYASRHDEQRMDIFKPFGFPSPIRSTRHYGALSQDGRGVNPAALTQGSSSAKPRDDPNIDVQAIAAPPTDSTGDPPISKRTMYGTELDNDTRFGDFGLEGMITDYWASGKF